jgi:predicted Fe-S protein YdhL (DUF1289 family)
MDEVINWPTMTDEEKKQVIENAKKRVEELKAKGQFVDYF